MKVYHSMMKLNFPAVSLYPKAIAYGVVLALAGYLLFPLLGLDATAPRALFAVALLLGALLGIVISAISVEAAAASGGDEGGPRKTIFVGNLAFKANRDELRQLFEKYGTVYSVRIMTDRVTRRPRGFAFVEMDAGGVAGAIKGLDGKEFCGRNLRVNEGSEQRPPRDAA